MGANPAQMTEMAPSPGESALERAARAVRAAGLTAIRVEHVSTLSPADRRRAAFKVDLADGRCIKARCFFDARRAWLHAAIRRGAAPIEGVEPFLLLDGTVVLDPWIDGTAVEHPPGDPLLRDAASLLARVHSTRSIAGRPRRAIRGTARWLESTLRRLRSLAESGAIAGHARDGLTSALRRWDPDVTEVGLCHGDFCAENLVRSIDGRLHSVDHEGLRIDSLDFDLGMVWYRWPMAESSFVLFQEQYEAAALRRVDHLLFWRIVALVKGAFVRARFRLRGADEVAARLSTTAMHLQMGRPFGPNRACSHE